MNQKEIIARIERLEKIALLNFGTLDVDLIETRLKAMNERGKRPPDLLPSADLKR